ncbi:hypothetical protein RSOLAG22IIIB_11475 [Rhizoctonia solani]|uniref:Zn(2)-C6 fungal-type domain-containing protein n=1 Tax=Rhizoctonia solani TaxID=456999 RepID=A0A0K6G8H8_9AGAM|nr:hypothetical protein RSOLAG22IIIB_11475 [Rhizoctonia solani]
MSAVQSQVAPYRPRRQYVARACNGCRRRRCKCDGAQPSCAPCLASGHKCTWGTDEDADSRPATKQFIASLQVKIQHLESEIAQLKQNETELPYPNHLLATPQYLSYEPVEPVATTGQDSSETRPQSPLHSGILPKLLCPTQPIRFAPVEVPITTLPVSIPPVKYKYIFEMDSALGLDEEYTSYQPSLACQWGRHLPDLSPVHFSRLEHDKILSRCFTYGASYSFGLLPDLFLAEMLECLVPDTARSPVGGPRYYSPLLHCSLLAFGVGLSENAEIRAQETRAKFATRAKWWLDEEFSRPSPSLVPSLLLLSEYHSGIGEWNTGHMYTGMAVRAARAQFGPSHAPVQDWHRWSAFVQGESN